MKTGKFTTTKKSNNKKPQLLPEMSAVVDLASTYIASWTKRELSRLQHESKKPLCIQTENGYLIGKFTIKKLPTEQWRVLDQDKQIIQDFYHKSGAVLYAIYSSKNNLVAAKDLLMLDAEFTKHDNDLRVYKYNIERAKITKNYVMYDKLVARADLSYAKKQYANDRLQHIFARAKFYKIWE